MIDLKNKKNIVLLVIIAISIIAMIVLSVGYVKELKTNSVTSEAKTTNNKEKKKKEKVIVTINVETIQDGLADMGFLVTQEYYFTQVEHYTKEKTVLKFFTSSSEFTYKYDGYVTAGIDFGKIAVSVNEDSKKISVNIPQSEIQTVSIDKDSFEIYSEKDSLWNPLKLEDYNKSLDEFEKVAKQKAIANGILERSDEQAKVLISNFVSNFPNASGYEIVFE